MAQEAQSVGTSSKEVGWYHPNLTGVPEETRQLLEEYSHIPGDQVIPHILRYVSRISFTGSPQLTKKHYTTRIVKSSKLIFFYASL